MKLKECRKTVQNFAIEMEIKLQENDHKSSYKNMTNEELIARMLEKIGEMLIDKNKSYEAIDVANFAMMIWDNN